MLASKSPAVEQPAITSTGGETERRPVIALAFLAAALAAGLLPASRPEAAPLSAAAGEFSSDRARMHVARLASSPRFMGSADHERARDYIMAEVTKLGITPEIQQTTAVRMDEDGIALTGNVQNILARIGGARGGRSVLLAAHYDTVPGSPGAADDASGVATLLETARALRAGPQPANDIILLFSDGEESGLLGAEAFASQHKWARDVAVALNFEARGSAGASYLFETSMPNGRLIREFRRAAAYPNGSSLFYEIYRVLPNDTDLTVFRRAGFGGMNFAFIDRVFHYHSPEDTEQNLDGRSLQQSGLYALSMARALGNTGVESATAADVIYFSVARSPLLIYPRGWAIPLSVSATALWAAALGIALWRRRVNLRAVAAGVIAPLFVTALAGGTGAALMAAVFAMRPDYRSFLMGDVYHHWALLGAGLVASSALAVLILRVMLRRWELFGMWLGVLLWASASDVALAALMPGASFLISWPHLIAAACALLLAISSSLSRRATLAAMAASLPWALLLASLFWQLPDALGLGAATPMALLAALLACWQLPLVAQWSEIRARGVLALAAGAVAVLLVIGFSQNRFDRRQPLEASLFYGLAADQGRAVWATRGPVVDHPWFHSHFRSGVSAGPLPEFALTADRRFTAAPAPLIVAAAPEAEVASITPSVSNMSRWNIRLRSLRGAPSLLMRPLGGGDSLRLVSVNGQGVVGGASMPIRALILRAARATGDEVVVDCPSNKRPAFQLLDWTPGLPASLGAEWSVRPPDLTMGPGFDLYNWSTVVSREFRPI